MFALATLVLLSTTGAAGGAVEPKLGLSVKPCILGKMNVPALCGTFGVYENRAARSGRIIELGVAVLKAPHPRGDAIAFIEGGPGQPTVVDAAWIADDHDLVLKAFRKNYDVVFVDNRGMGVSNPTHCNISPYSDMPAYFLQIWSDGIISGCYHRYARTSNPSQYNTNNAVDDLDAVREALGYRKLVLYGDRTVRSSRSSIFAGTKHTYAVRFSKGSCLRISSLFPVRPTAHRPRSTIWLRNVWPMRNAASAFRSSAWSSTPCFIDSTQAP